MNEAFTGDSEQFDQPEKVGVTEGAKLALKNMRKERGTAGYSMGFEIGALVLMGPEYEKGLAENPNLQKLIEKYLGFSVYLNEIIDREKFLREHDRKRWLWELQDKYREYALELDKVIESKDQRLAISTAVNDIISEETTAQNLGESEVSFDRIIQYRERVNAANVAAISALFINKSEIYSHFEAATPDERYKWVEKPQNQDEARASGLYYMTMAMQIIDDWNHRKPDREHGISTIGLEAEKLGSVKGRLVLANKFAEYCKELDKYFTRPALIAALGTIDVGLKAYEFLFKVMKADPRLRHSLVSGFFGIKKQLPDDGKVSVLRGSAPKAEDIYFVDGKFDQRTPEEIIAGKVSESAGNQTAEEEAVE